ncbi:hypothetical protein [Legionella birminghamensis]|nr:hypothetical protein [Legionella birminghamensis]
MPSEYNKTLYSSLKQQAIKAIEEENVEGLKELLKQSYGGLLPNIKRKASYISVHSPQQGRVPYLNNCKDKKFLRDLAIEKDSLAIVDFLFNDGMGVETDLRTAHARSLDTLEKSYKDRFLAIAVQHNSRKVINYLVRKGYTLTPEQLRDYAKNNKAEKPLKAITPVLDKLPLLSQKVKDLADRGYIRESQLVAGLEGYLKTELKTYIDACIAEPEKSGQFLEKNLKPICIASTSFVQGKLKNHRGCKELLGNVLITLASLTIANFCNLIATRGRAFFFEFNTDSVNKINEVETGLIHCSL